jgi:acetolactate synthase-1/2/3 large subunit
MVRQWQEMFYENRYSESNLSTVNPDFIKLTESFGAKACRATNTIELKQALSDMMLCNESPYLLEVAVKPDENVYPMIAPGKGHNEMLFKE